MKHLILSCLILLNIYASSEYDEAYVLYKADNFEPALEIFIKLANKNDYDAAYILGFMYEHGEGCTTDIQKSQKWYKVSSHGYYWNLKPNPMRDSDKAQKKLYESLEHSDDEETRYTTRQIVESLFNIKAYNPNYFLPVSYRFEGDYPVQGKHSSKNIETEFQISIRYDFTQDLFGLNEIYSIAYTQHSYWQLYTESAFFRESNYNPELFVTIPTSFPGYAQALKAIKLSFEHESNGRGGAEERSWNYLAGSFMFQTGFLFTEFKAWYRLPDSFDYNPELIDYMGHGHIKFILPYKKHLITLRLRNSFSGESSTELNYSYPAFGSDDLFFFVKGFNGYGESLIDYNHNITKLAVGFSISR